MFPLLFDSIYIYIYIYIIIIYTFLIICCSVFFSLSLSYVPIISYSTNGNVAVSNYFIFQSNYNYSIIETFKTIL